MGREGVVGVRVAFGIAPSLLIWAWLAHTPAFLTWARAHWPAVLPLMYATLMITRALAGRLWAAVAALLMVITAFDIGLGGHQPEILVGMVAAFAVGVGLILAGLGSLRSHECAAQAACESTQEEANTLQETVAALETSRSALQVRLQRYTTLRTITEVLASHSTELERLLATVANQGLVVLDHADSALVYLLAIPRHRLELRAARMRDVDATPIKRKTGDVIDDWVFRQGQPLMVRDVRNDFRFSLNATVEEEGEVGSLIAAPLISAQRLLGVLRAESRKPDAFSPEDLRLLSILADLAAMSIESARLYARTSELAVTDDLTGLAVHRYFHERLEEELARAQHRRTPVSVLLIDVDHFKSYNDRYGHPAGDKLLRTIAQTLRQHRGPGDLIARYGGEEFAILLNGVTRQAARDYAETIRRLMETQDILLRQGTARVTVSIGVAAFPDDGHDREAIVDMADRRLYQAKSNGRNQVCAA